MEDPAPPELGRLASTGLSSQKRQFLRETSGPWTRGAPGRLPPLFSLVVAPWLGLSQLSMSTSPLSFPGGAQSTVGMTESLREEVMDHPTTREKPPAPRPPSLFAIAGVRLASRPPPGESARTPALPAGARGSPHGTGAGGAPQPPANGRGDRAGKHF